MKDKIKRTKILQVRMTPQEKKLLEDLAHSKGLPLSDFVRRELSVERMGKP